MYWVDYDSQRATEGFDYVGTDDLQYPITVGMDLSGTVAELQRRCGRFARIKLFRKESAEVDGDR